MSAAAHPTPFSPSRIRSLAIADLCVCEVETVELDASVARCAQLMRSQHVGSLVVIDRESRQPMGIVTDRDIVVEVVATGLDATAITATDIMSTPVASVLPSDDLIDALARMRERGVRRICVIDAAGALTGILAVDNVVEALAEQTDALVRVFRSQSNRELSDRP
jgi:CBS domain-containing protein